MDYVVFDELVPLSPEVWDRLVAQQRQYNVLRSMLYENVQWIAFPPVPSMPLHQAAEAMRDFGGCCE